MTSCHLRDDHAERLLPLPYDIFMQDLYNLYFITLGITKASRLTFPGLTWYNFPFNKDYLVTTA